MSASSQSSGTNYLTLSGLSQLTQFAACGWFKLNSWTKLNYGTVVDVGFGNSNPSRGTICLQQDWDGSGSAHTLQPAWYRESTSATNSFSSIQNSTGVWMFVFIYVNTTSLTIYYGTETGSLSTVTDTITITAAEITSIILASDRFGSAGVGELADVSLRGWRVWSDTTFNSSEVTAERDSSTFAPVKTSGLVSDTRMASGTNPETATSGSSWTRTGTFTTDASNPAFGTTLTPGVCTETDAALAVTFAHQGAPGLSAETDSALSRTLIKGAATSFGETTDIAHSLALAKYIAPGLSSETATALSTFSAGITPGLATEAETALGSSLARSLATGSATEAAAALASSLRKTLTVNSATEAAAALAVAASKPLAQGLATEVSTALTVTASKTIAVALATSAETALTIPIVKTGAAGLAIESDVAQSLSLTSGFSVSASAEVDVSVSGSIVKQQSPSAAVAAEAALALTIARALTNGIAIETETALPSALVKALTPARADSSELAFGTYASVTYINTGRADDSCNALALSITRTLAPASPAPETDAASSLSLSKMIGVRRADADELALSTFGDTFLETGSADSGEQALPLPWRASPAQQWAAFRAWTSNLGRFSPGN